jgi:erythritol transport system ATP-binding protein
VSADPLLVRPPSGPFVRARWLTKTYGGTTALADVDFEVHPGEVNVLVGENGAGKSTLMRILAGVERPTSGRLLLGDEPIELHSPRDAAALGIGVIHQELSLFPDLDVTDNVFMARERTRHGMVVDRRRQERRVAETLARLEHPLDPRTRVGHLPLGLQQIVEIARALVQDVRILMMDEPTSALSAVEVAALFRVIRDLVERGVGVVYVSHRLDELMQIGDRITVLRDGRRVAHAPVSDVDLAWIVENMVGRSGRPRPERDSTVEGAAVLDVKGLSLWGPAGERLLGDVSLVVRRGEVVALYGLMGAGRTELLESLAGARGAVEGQVEIDGHPVQGLSLPDRIRRGVTLIPEDRQGAGIVPPLSVTHNVTLSSLRAHARAFWLVGGKERDTLERVRGELDIRMADPDRPITALSGGNQQKVVVARALLTSPRVLLMDEPTRGIDVAARGEMFDLMRRLADRGMAILYSSSDLNEVVGIADRVVVLSNGRVTGEFDGHAVTERELVEASYVGHTTGPGEDQNEG